MQGNSCGRPCLVYRSKLNPASWVSLYHTMDSSCPVLLPCLLWGWTVDNPMTKAWHSSDPPNWWEVVLVSKWRPLQAQKPSPIPSPNFLTMRSEAAPWHRNSQSLWEGCSVCTYNMKPSTMGFASVIHDTKGNKGILAGISVLPIFKAKARQNDLMWQLKPAEQWHAAPADYHGWTWHLLSQALTQIRVLPFTVFFWGGGIKWP